MSRRAFVGCGICATGVLVGTASGTAGATRAAQRDDLRPAERGVMFPCQVVSDHRVTIVERDPEWRPRGLESTHRTHVVSYDHAPSLRAFLFTEKNASVGSHQSLALGRVRDPVSETNRRAVTVDLEPIELSEPDGR